MLQDLYQTLVQKHVHSCCYIVFLFTLLKLTDTLFLVFYHYGHDSKANNKKSKESVAGGFNRIKGSHQVFIKGSSNRLVVVPVNVLNNLNSLCGASPFQAKSLLKSTFI